MQGAENIRYRKYVPGKYSDYIPEMDDSGIKYQKYMQGQPDAMKFQEKVLPEGNYQHYIPLSQNGKADKTDAVLLAAAQSEKKDDSKDRKAKGAHESDVADSPKDHMDFEKYLHAPTPGPVVDSKYRKYVPGKYSDYIPEMDDSGIKYQKYMQGQPDAMKFQEKVLPEGNYQHYIPLSQNGKADKTEAVLLAAAQSEKKDDSKDRKAKGAHESDVADSPKDHTDFEKYLHAPTPGPVVDSKYRKYVPGKYSDYIPEMDDSGIKYQKYMQGQPDAMKFQEKVLPEGNYQHYIPLSQNGKAHTTDAVLLAAAQSEKKDDSKDRKAKGAHESDVADSPKDHMDFEKYLHAPTPGPVVDSKYRKYVPGKYSDYIPEMDDSGIKYQKYMQGQPDAMKFQEKVLPEGNYQHYIPLSQNGKADKTDAVLLAAAQSEKKDDSKDRKAKGAHESDVAGSPKDHMDFEKYLHAPTPGPVVDSKYRKYVPGKYSDYIPEMDDSGIKYQKYMQGQPDAMKFQEKVLPEGNYQHYIPLSPNGKADKTDAVLLAAAQSEKKDDSKDRKAKGAHESDVADSPKDHMDFEKYLHAPTPGPVVDSKYRKYVPGKYSDYIPEMDDSGIKYQKYMQGQPDAMKFQEKVLPEGNYQHYIPLSQNGKADKTDAVLLAAAQSEKKDDSKDRKAKGAHESDVADSPKDHMDFEKYLHAPTPGPVVDSKYRKYVPGKYSDYIPEMDDSGIKYQKYMPEKLEDASAAGSVSKAHVAHEDCVLKNKA